MERDDLDQTIRGLQHLPSADQRAEVGRITGLLYPQLRAWAPGWTRRAGDLAGRHGEDAIQVAAVTVLEVLHEYATGRRHQSVGAWTPYLYAVCQASISKWLKTAAATGVAGRTNLERRVARIPRAPSCPDSPSVRAVAP